MELLKAIVAFMTLVSASITYRSARAKVPGIDGRRRNIDWDELDKLGAAHGSLSDSPNAQSALIEIRRQKVLAIVLDHFAPKLGWFALGGPLFLCIAAFFRVVSEKMSPLFPFYTNLFSSIFWSSLIYGSLWTASIIPLWLTLNGRRKWIRSFLNSKAAHLDFGVEFDAYIDDQRLAKVFSWTPRQIRRLVAYLRSYSWLRRRSEAATLLDG